MNKKKKNAEHKTRNGTVIDRQFTVDLECFERICVTRAHSQNEGKKERIAHQTKTTEHKVFSYYRSVQSYSSHDDGLPHNPGMGSDVLFSPREIVGCLKVETTRKLFSCCCYYFNFFFFFLFRICSFHCLHLTSEQSALRSESEHENEHRERASEQERNENVKLCACAFCTRRE